MASTPTETSPLLSAATTVSVGDEEGQTDTHSQPPPPPAIPGLVWIEVAIFANVFLAGFDGTVTASTYAVITSEFRRANLASWISTSYLVATTALQPLYGRLSDIFGRRVCLLAATTLFGLGCLGCGLSPNLAALIAMRALAGAGGGGLMTMATIINTDLIAPEQRGMYQAVQNILHGVGSILGASLGGTIAGAIGWRFSFLLQVPVSLAALVVAHIAVPAKITPRHAPRVGKPGSRDADAMPAVLGNALADPLLEVEDVAPDVEPGTPPGGPKAKSTWAQVDFLGALLLIAGLSTLLAALSAGSNELSWTDPLVVGCLAGGLGLLGAFLVVEARTTAVPLLPLSMLHGVERVALLIANVNLGIASYGFLFLMPLFFQAVLLDSASVAGLRLVASSLATPLGGLTVGLVMKYCTARHPGTLRSLSRAGTGVFFAGSAVNLLLGMHDSAYKYAGFLAIGGFGQGMSYPASLFSFMGACDFAEHAVATYLVYLVRSIGAVCGVAAISTLVQASLVARLTEAFADAPGGADLVDTLTHSVEAIRDLPPDTRMVVQTIYYEACRVGLYFLLGVNAVAFVCTLLIPRRRRSTRPI